MYYTYGEETFTLEMWTPATPGPGMETFTMKFPSVTRNGKDTRRHDALRTLATYVLATADAPTYQDGTYGIAMVRPRVRDIRVNSMQGIAWVNGHPERVAYFRSTEERVH